MKLADDSSHTVLVGRNGSGKTQAAAWQLSMRSYDAMPWIILNSKNDRLLNRTGAVELPLHAAIPRKPGLYMVRHMPRDPAADALLMRAWKKENVGIFVDEVYNLPRNGDGFHALLTQGRSKYVPLILCVQRPVFVDRSVWSECNYAQIFSMTNGRDRKIIDDEMTPGDTPIPWSAVKKYHSIYLDMREGSMALLRPVPSGRAILSEFHTRLANMPQHRERIHRWV